MQNEYWGFKKIPFNNVPDPAFFFSSKVHREALSRINYAVEMSQGVALLTGDIGCGKTILSRIFINNLTDVEYDIALIVNPMLSHDDFLREVLYQFGVSESSNVKLDLLHVLNDRILENSKVKKNTVIIIDEAQLIEDKKILEELRLLLNFQTNDRFLLNLILIGQDELRENISNIRQLDQRVAIRYHLKPLDENDTYKYMVHRLKMSGMKKNIFTTDAYSKTFELSRGIPRLINNICNLSMVIAQKSKKNSIDSNIILDAARVNYTR